jgi:diadenosine tetraphosphatase ApaH/serine/threonine PP2A family protein phosphatase
VVERVRALVAEGAIAIRGNHDEAVVQGPREGMNSDATQVINWTRSQLDDDQLTFLSRLPFAVERYNCLFAHANGYAPQAWEYVTSRSEALQSLHAPPCPTPSPATCMSPALQPVRSRQDFELHAHPGVGIPVPTHRQWFVLPGSAGQPRDGNPAACWALFEPGQALLTFQRVPYDHDAAAAKIIAAGLPHVWANV